MLLCERKLLQGNELQDDPDRRAKMPQAPITALRGELMLLDGEAFPFPTTIRFPPLHLSLLSCPHEALLKALQTPNHRYPAPAHLTEVPTQSRALRKVKELLGEHNTWSTHGHMSQRQSSMN